MKDLERIEELIEHEIKPLTSKQDISPTELERLGEAVDILKDVETIRAMKEAEYEYQDDEYSQARGRGRGRYNSYDTPNPMSHDGSYDMYRPYIRSYDTPNQGTSNNQGMSNGNSMMNSNDGRRGRDGDGDGRYSEGYSTRRGRDRMGRYTSRDYSRHSEKEYMIDRLEDMADDARTEREREIIERCIYKLERH